MLDMVANTDPLALTALGGFARVIVVTIGLFAFILTRRGGKRSVDPRLGSSLSPGQSQSDPAGSRKPLRCQQMSWRSASLSGANGVSLQHDLRGPGNRAIVSEYLPGGGMPTISCSAVLG